MGLNSMMLVPMWLRMSGPSKRWAVKLSLAEVVASAEVSVMMIISGLIAF